MDVLIAETFTAALARLHAQQDVHGLEQDRTGTVSVFNGPQPTIFRAPDEAAERDAAAEFVTVSMADGIAPAEIGVFVRSPDEIDPARVAVEAAGLRSIEVSEQMEATGDRIAIGAMHLAKGLEFKAVAVMACDEEIMPQQARVETVADDVELDEIYETERHLYYVACTRARDRLFISAIAPGSDFWTTSKADRLVHVSSLVIAALRHSQGEPC